MHGVVLPQGVVHHSLRDIRSTMFLYFLFHDTLEEFRSFFYRPFDALWHDLCMFHYFFLLLLPSPTLFTKFHDRSITFNRTFLFFLWFYYLLLSLVVFALHVPIFLAISSTAYVITSTPSPLITDRSLRHYKASLSSVSYLVFIYQIPLHLDGHWHILSLLFNYLFIYLGLPLGAGNILSCFHVASYFLFVSS